MAPAAERFECGDYKRALLMLKKAKIIYPYQLEELHYIRGLCLQSLKRFDESKMEYEWILARSSVGDLATRATTGLNEVSEKKQTPSEDQWRFPRTSHSPDIF